MSYENRYLWLKGSKGQRGGRGPRGETGPSGTKGTDGVAVAQREITVSEPVTNSTTFTVTDSVGGASISTGTIKRVGSLLEVITTLPTNKPPTAETGRMISYYAKIPNEFTFLNGVDRLTDDGLSAFSISTITRSGLKYLQFTHIGGAGNGVISAII